MGYKNILVALDVAEEAEDVLAAAKAQASDDGATISAITVVKPITQTYGGLDWAPSTAGFEEAAIKQATENITALAQKFDLKMDNLHVVVGRPSVEIKRLAEDHNCDIIVIGTHGRHGLGLLLGSTANAVLHGVTCDVLAVRVQPESG